MKVSTFLARALWVVCLVGCLPAWAAPVTETAVRTSAENFLVLRYPATGTASIRTETPLGATSLGIASVTPWQPTGETLAYVVKLEPDGFVLMRVDDRQPPLKLYSRNGEFLRLPPAFLDVLEWELSSELKLLETVRDLGKLQQTFEHEWTALASSGEGNAPTLDAFRSSPGLDTGPLLSTTWDQDDPYNLYAPAAAGGPDGRAYAGCVAVAMGQILKHHEHPAAILADYTYTDTTGSCTGRHSCSDATLAPYDWVNMPASVSGSSSAIQKHAVGQLLYHCAVCVEMRFEADGSAARSHDVVNALRCLLDTDAAEPVKRSAYTDTAWYNALQADMTAGRPVYYAMDSNLGASHALVCDGTRNGNEIHINFGWDGSYDAWYNLNSIQTGSRTWSDHRAIMEISAGGDRPTYALDVATRYPHHGVSIQASPLDTGGDGGGTAPFSRVYTNGAIVTLTAPASVSGEPFLYWDIDKIGRRSNRVVTLEARVRRDVEAVYAISGPPENDNLADAIALSGTSGTAYGKNALSTIEADEPDHAQVDGPFNSVWWKLTPSAAGWTRINTRGSNFDTVMALYMGASVAELTEVASNDDGAEWPCSDIEAWLAPEVTYYVAVGGCYEDSLGDVTLNWSTVPVTECYVSPSGSNHAPYDSWQSAAVDIDTVLGTASAGTMIIVTSATYTLSAPVEVDTEVYLMGAGPSMPILDGNGAGPCIEVRVPAVVDGFIITNGTAVKDPEESEERGGGVRLDGAGVLRNCVIAGNSSAGHGGGVYCHEGGTVSDCTVSGNTAKWGGGLTLMHGGMVRGGLIAGNTVTETNSSAGAGVNCDHGGTLIGVTVSNNISVHDGGGVELYCGGTARDCTVVNNAAKLGGGFCIVWSKADGGHVEDCVVRGNTSTEKGGGIRCYDGGVVRNCLVVSNRSEHGGGIQVESFARVEGCTLVSNRATYAGGAVSMNPSDCVISESVLNANSANSFGGGIVFWGGGEVRNCLVTDNRAWRGGGCFYWYGGRLLNCTFSDNLATDTVYGGGGVWYEGAGHVINSILYHNTGGPGANYHNASVIAGAYSNCCATPALGVGGDHTSAPPLFVNRADGNYRLAMGSPCIDTALAAVAPDEDLDAVPRPLDGDNAGGAAPDMGAYETVHDGADSDGDTLGDRWELDHGLSPVVSTGDQGKDGDPDNDGLCNSDEEAADTHPLDPASCLALLGIRRETAGLRLEWQGGVSVTQVVECHPDFTDTVTPWICLYTNFPDTPVTNDHLFTVPTDQMYYRIRIAD